MKKLELVIYSPTKKLFFITTSASAAWEHLAESSSFVSLYSVQVST